MGLLPGSNQEYLGRIPVEHGQRRGISLGNGFESGQGEWLLWSFHRQPGGRDNLVGREGARVDRVSKEAIRGGPQEPKVCLQRTAEVTPTRVGINAEGHPIHMRRLWTSRDVPLGHVHPGPLPGRRRGNHRARGHPPAS